MRGAWIEIRTEACAALPSESLPVRGAWIEIKSTRARGANVTVAPRAGSVD